jgi:hypothetical protein
MAATHNRAAASSERGRAICLSAVARAMQWVAAALYGAGRGGPGAAGDGEVGEEDAGGRRVLRATRGRVARSSSPARPPSPSGRRSGPRLSARLLRAPARRRKTLVLDLDETLIHSSANEPPLVYDTKIEVMIESSSSMFYVARRPHADYFLRQASQWYELVIFTASMAQYAEPVIDWLDPRGLITRRYFREVRHAQREREREREREGGR